MTGLAGLAVILTEHRAVVSLHVEALQLEATKEELEREIATLRSPQEFYPDAQFVNEDLSALRANALQIHGLRNQVTQLRNRRELLHKEVSAIPKAESTTGSEQNDELPAYSPDYLQRHRFTYAGQDTPESALQTLFWAITHDDIEAFMRVSSNEELSPDQAKSLTATLGKDLLRFPGYRVVARSTMPPNLASLSIETAQGGATIRLLAIHNENGWKISVPNRFTVEQLDPQPPAGP
jgi:hypothetical protein